ncbi:DUF397 domain-containing protein [Microbispora sp. ATCC PTA-5024]|uniref:DUF397 domain-containing protein n=1 Tax=Microbispora sp. ATCC PTA-5024 TaxID=316330 RepID=UPI0003DD40EC|nr:DUF397 domain-containing protein [Microbispora sp. ATCC PTA-5024]ETK36156.1 hypothetical protein MPTA5024_11055 [Microbispora sp. ATCC PTA-5024]
MSDRIVWRSSSACNGGSCVAVAVLPDGVGVTDTKQPGGPVLVFGPGEWTRFLDEAKAGKYDLPAEVPGA